MASFQDNLSKLDFAAARDDGGGGTLRQSFSQINTTNIPTLSSSTVWKPFLSANQQCHSTGGRTG